MKIRISNVSFIRHKYLLYALLIGIGNVFFSDSEILGTIFSYAQIMLPIVMLCFGKVNSGICYMLIGVILGLSYDMGYGAYTGMWYTVKTIKLFGINLGFWVLLPFLFLALISKKMWKALLKKSKDVFTQMVQIIIAINVISLIVGIFNVFILNDNNIQSLDNYLSHLLGLVYTPFLATLGPLFILYWRMIDDSGFIKELKETAESVFVAMIVAALVSFASGNVGVKMDTQYVWVSVAGVFFPYFIIFPFYKEVKNKIKWFVFGVAGMVFGLYFFSNGKMMLSLIPLMLIFSAVLLRKENRKLLFFVAGVIALSLVLLGISDVTIATTRIMQSKFNYALRLLDITNENWWDLIPPSPKWRLIEIMNITKEYITKPYMFILGKGMLGTVKDYTDYLSQFYGVTSAAYMEEWESGLFFSMHETMNMLYLRNGFLGLWSMGWFGIKMFKYYQYSPYILIGCVWYLIYYGYAYTVTLFGVMVLMIGFYEVSQKRNDFGWQI